MIQDLFACAGNLGVTTIVLLVFTGLLTVIPLFAYGIGDLFRGRNS